ncbi:MAG: ABC transporter ATP-binding protein [Fimbriimonadaceae bacterium]|nr:ABC transporter ATP-binding protein [Fimbriimonadaceae bacterium]
MVSVILHEVGQRFGRRVLFSGLSLRVEPGEVVVVAGLNGAGKSTLLRLIAGLLRPSTGEVWLERAGQRLDAEQRRASLGYLSPDTLPYRALTVRENLDFYSRVRGLPRWDAAVVELLGLADRLEQPVAELSSGYVQRVKLAVAMLHQPAVLLLDEPGITLDEAGHQQVAAVVAEQRQRGCLLLAANDPRDLAYGTTIIRVGG